MRRAIDAHLKATRLFPSLSSLSSSSSSSPTPLLSVRTILTLPHPQNPSISKTLNLHSITTSWCSSIPSLRSQPQIGSNFNVLVVRCVSSVPHADTLEWNEPLSCSEVGDGHKAMVDENAMPSIPVRAYFFSTSVDLRSLVEQNRLNFIPPTSRMTNYVVFRFGEPSDSNNLISSIVACFYCFPAIYANDRGISFVFCFMVVAPMGEEYEVREKPALHTWMEGGLDYIMLQYLNVDGIRTIGSVLGQSIALDYYVRQVDGMVAEFTDINREMETTGKFKMKRKKLFQLVGKANSNLADVILKLGLFERSDIAWKDAKYAQIWEYLRDEFELTQRFASLDFKLKFVEHNIRFLQEILQNRKSDFLEWLIIALIGAEILLSVYDIVHRSALATL
ncbi:hypothetical protein GBA52_007035 [Prunus armeniaca]|nr:hypothetical protein GBA52_007035 [Prunus armeniaca]